MVNGSWTQIYVQWSQNTKIRSLPELHVCKHTKHVTQRGFKNSEGGKLLESGNMMMGTRDVSFWRKYQTGWFEFLKLAETLEEKKIWNNFGWNLISGLSPFRLSRNSCLQSFGVNLTLQKKHKEVKGNKRRLCTKVYRSKLKLLKDNFVALKLQIIHPPTPSIPCSPSPSRSRHVSSRSYFLQPKCKKCSVISPTRPWTRAAAFVPQMEILWHCFLINSWTSIG